MSIVGNASIESADIVFSRGVFLDCWLQLSFGNSTSQGFGGYVLGARPDSDAAANQHDKQPNIAGEFISQVMAIGGVEKFSDLPGKIVRVRKVDEWGAIEAIGHAIKDMWFNPSERMEQMRLKGGAA